MTQITLLDGSIGQELVKRAGDKPTALWSTQAMIDHPDLVRAVHAAYFDAGATIATTNTYATLRDRLMRVGLEEDADRLVQIAVTEARAARDAAGGGRVAGAVGPLGASYRPDLCPPVAEAAALYEELLMSLDGNVDFLLFETMSSVEQAEGALVAAQQSAKGMPVWLALTVEDKDGTRLRSGEKLEMLAPLIERFEPDAVLINCSPPEVISESLTALAEFGRPFGAYGNGFTKISDGFLQEAPTVDALESRTDLDPAAYARFAMSWVAQGATIVGGCCEVGPAHIAELAQQLRAAGHEII